MSSALPTRRIAIVTAVGGLALSSMVVSRSAEALTPGWIDSSYGQMFEHPGDLPGVASAVDSSGRLLVVSGSTAPGGLGAVSRLTVNGATDAGFGASGSTSLPSGPAYSAVLVGSDGIYVAGRPQSGNGVVLARLTPGGILDSGYGTGGLATVAIPNTVDAIDGLTQLDSGDVVIAGRHDRNLPHVSYLAATTASGVLDTTWNAAGTTPGVRTLTDRVAGVDHDGNAAVAATVDSTGLAHLRRFAANGTPDGTFGSSGAMSLPSSFSGHHVDVGPDGAYYVAGSSGHSAHGPLAVARVLSGGTLDSGFGASGVANVTISDNEPTGSFTVVTASYVYVFGTHLTDGSPIIARLTSDGVLDQSFGSGGFLEMSGGDFRASGADLDGYFGGGLQPSGKPLLVFRAHDMAGDGFQGWAAFRLNASTSAPAGAFVPLLPSRLLDTRTGNGAPKGAVGAGGSVTLQVSGRDGVPAVGVEAVALNVTAVTPTRSGFLTVYPAGSARPTASNLNHQANATTPNLVTVALGAGGQIVLYNGSVGTAHLLADVAGYYLGGVPTVPGAFAVLPATRVLDTRNGIGVAAQPVPAHSTLSLTVAGAGGVPPTGASSVVINATVTNQASSGFLTIFPSGTTRPTASNVNFVAAQTRANLATVRLGSDGKLNFYNGSNGTVDLLADVAGDYVDGTPTAPGTFVAVDPIRILDTRTGAHGIASGADLLVIPNLGGNEASALVVNATVTKVQRAGYATFIGTDTWYDHVYPNSTLNFVAGQTTANLAITSGDLFLVHNGTAGTIQAVADLAGYFQP
jgi:uncharacterized delta-60 repeat protein